MITVGAFLRGIFGAVTFRSTLTFTVIFAILIEENFILVVSTEFALTAFLSAVTFRSTLTTLLSAILNEDQR